MEVETEIRTAGREDPPRQIEAAGRESKPAEVTRQHAEAGVEDHRSAIIVAPHERSKQIRHPVREQRIGRRPGCGSYVAPRARRQVSDGGDLG
jgi:hypothetical protein